MKIYCPKCQWKPRPPDLWSCFPGCGHAWNTFETRAQCPNCLKQWKKTQCLRCNVSSQHAAWYHDEGGDLEALDRLLAGAENEPGATQIEEAVPAKAPANRV